ncbi:UNVERIFIED_CONTAM: Calmodulin-binding protein 60 A [Sesamum calycinum]|uniref:Calmodulin-binding protein 60 A n=1 Tax=Sesamum calycinum TaxID=2727403 RepID=A0AAW2SV01_9LAMI
MLLIYGGGELIFEGYSEASFQSDDDDESLNQGYSTIKVTEILSPIFHLLREIMSRGDVRMDRVSSAKNTADPLTNLMSQIAHTQQLDKIVQYVARMVSFKKRIPPLSKCDRVYKKHHPPSLSDEVWRLEIIGKDGAFHKRPRKERVNAVQDFLMLLFLDPTRLQNILGTGMSAKMWEVTVEHARTCVLDEKLYLYNTTTQKNAVVFDVVDN